MMTSDWVSGDKTRNCCVLCLSNIHRMPEPDGNGNLEFSQHAMFSLRPLSHNLFNIYTRLMTSIMINDFGVWHSLKMYREFPTTPWFRWHINVLIAATSSRWSREHKAKAPRHPSSCKHFKYRGICCIIDYGVYTLARYTYPAGCVDDKHTRAAKSLLGSIGLDTKW